MKKIDEMNVVAGVQGTSGPFKLGKKAAVYPYNQKAKEKKKKYVAADLQETILRQAIRTIIFNAKMDFFNSKAKTTLQENKLRSVIRSLLSEKSETSPYNTTGLNVASETMTRIERSIVDGYKSLTTSLEQRQDYLKTVLEMVKDAIKRQDMMRAIEAGKTGGVQPALPAGSAALPVSPQGITELANPSASSLDAKPALPIEPDKTADQKSLEIGKQIASQVLKKAPDTTGGTRAVPVVTTIVPQILSARDTLKDDQDRQIFDLAIIGGNGQIGNIEAFCNKAEKTLQATNGVGGAETPQPTDQSAAIPPQPTDGAMPPVPPSA
jgi:hypothetical protein